MGKLLVWLFAAGKLGKLLTTGGTMLLSMLVYTWVFGWRYAAGFVVLLFVHEMGHYVAARQRGVEVGAVAFIPFVGAWVSMKDAPANAETDAYIGFAGPAAGTLAAMSCYFAARDTGSQLLLALAYSGCMLNLINLIPLMPLDGGRITAIVSPKLWLVGMPLLVALFLWRPSPMLILVGLLALPQLKQAFAPADAGTAAYYDTPMETRVNYGAMYLGLVAFLAVMSFSIHTNLRA